MILFNLVILRPFCFKTRTLLCKYKCDYYSFGCHFQRWRSLLTVPQRWVFMEDSLYCYDNPDSFFELVYLVRELISSRTLLTSSPRLLLAPLFRTCEATWPALMYCHPRRAYHRTHCCRYPQRRRYVFLMRLTRILLGARSTEGEQANMS